MTVRLLKHFEPVAELSESNLYSVRTHVFGVRKTTIPKQALLCLSVERRAGEGRPEAVTSSEVVLPAAPA